MRILTPFSHRICISHFSTVFRLFRIFTFFFSYFSHFRALFTTSGGINREKSTIKVDKVQKCEKNAKGAMQMRNANTKCECDAKKVRCDAMNFNKKCKCDAKKFLHYHPCAVPVFFFFFICANVPGETRDVDKNVSLICQSANLWIWNQNSPTVLLQRL